MKHSWWTLLALACVLAACGGESHKDLRAWMSDQGKGVKGRLDPLPQIKAYEPFTYNAFDLPDPFKPRKIEASKGSKFAPDLTRRREPRVPFGSRRGQRRLGDPDQSDCR